MTPSSFFFFDKSLVKRAFGQADQGQGRQAVGQVCLDDDAGRFHADLGAAMDDGEGHGSLLDRMPPARRGLLGGFGGGRRELGFHFRDLGFQRLEARAGTGEDDHLAVEFVAADQVELAEGALHQNLELGFQLGLRQGRFATEQTSGLLADGIEEGFGRQHGSWVPD